MSTYKKGQLTVSDEWKQHLRPNCKRIYWKGERATERRVKCLINEFEDNGFYQITQNLKYKCKHRKKVYRLESLSKLYAWNLNSLINEKTEIFIKKQVWYTIGRYSTKRSLLQAYNCHKKQDTLIEHYRMVFPNGVVTYIY